jgi:hypothetical protein
VRNAGTGCYGCEMSPTHRRVARAPHAGGPEVIEVGVEEVAPLSAGEALVRVEAAGLNRDRAKRVDGIRAAGANRVIDRTTEDVRDAVRAYTAGAVPAINLHQLFPGPSL